MPSFLNRGSLVNKARFCLEYTSGHSYIQLNNEILNYTQDLTATFVLCNIIDFYRYGVNNGLFNLGDSFYYTYEKMKEKYAFLTDFIIRKSINSLKELGILDFQKKGLPAKYVYTIDFDRLYEIETYTKMEALNNSISSGEKISSLEVRNFNDINKEIYIKKENISSSEEFNNSSSSEIKREVEEILRKEKIAVSSVEISDVVDRLMNNSYVKNKVMYAVAILKQKNQFLSSEEGVKYFKRVVDKSKRMFTARFLKDLKHRTFRDIDEYKKLLSDSIYDLNSGVSVPDDKRYYIDCLNAGENYSNKWSLVNKILKEANYPEEFYFKE